MTAKNNNPTQLSRKRRPLIRTRTGCLCCRRRRKKCDEQRPRCGACVRLRFNCNYDLVLNWQEGNQILVLDHLHSPCNFLSLLRANVTQFLVSGYADMEFYNAITKCQSISVSKFFPTTRKCKLQLENGLSNGNGPRDKEEEHLFEYYVEVICRRKVFSDSLFNEFRAVTIPRSGMSSSLFQSIMAIAASDMERNNPARSDYYRLLTLKYQNNAIDLLYNSLDNPDPKCMTVLIITIIILCSLEIGDNATGRWVNHLQEACLVMQSIEDEQILSSTVLLFGYRYFALRYYLLLTTLNQEHYLKFTSNTPLRMIESFFDSNIIDHLFGCCPKLIFLIHNIVKLKNSPQEDKRDSIFQIYNELEEIEQVDLEDDERLTSCAQLYLNITKVYFQNLFKIDICQLGARYPSIELKPTDSIITESFQLFHKLTDINRENSALLPTWTLFIMATNGSHQIDDTLRVNVLQIFDKMERLWPKASPAVIRTAIELIWKSQDLGFVEQTNMTSLARREFSPSWQDVICSSGMKLALT